MALVSVIMPVYNVQDYVHKTIESVLNQTLQDIEFWAIDDGSQDDSGIICDEYATKDPRLHVIHQKNGGAPAARNSALELASGKYVYFIDSDDWIESDYLERMYTLAEKNNADLIVTGFSMEYYQNGEYVTYYTPCPDKIYTTIDEFRKDAYHYFNASILSLPWNKLFLLKEIHEKHLRFKNTKWDDHHFCMDYLMDCKNVVLSSMTKYHWYRSRKGSETMINYSDVRMFEKRKEHFEHIIQLYQHWGVDDADSIDAISCYYSGRLAQCVQELADNKKIIKAEKIAKIKEILNDPITIDTLQKSKSLSKKMKIMITPMRWKNIGLSLLMGDVINFVRKVAPGLFIKMKEQEVHSALVKTDHNE